MSRPSSARPYSAAATHLSHNRIPTPLPRPHTIRLHSVGSLVSTLAPFSVPNFHSIPIAQRVRRKRQRLPSSLLIENASDSALDPRTLFCPRHFRSSLATIQPCVWDSSYPELVRPTRPTEGAVLDNDCG